MSRQECELSPEPGSRLGPYEIRGRLGEGGAGEVFRAHDPRLERDVAIKVLSGPVTSDSGLRQRFEGEAKAVAALSHPNVIAIYDVGGEGEIAYVVTELLDGETLRERLRQGPLPVSTTVDFACQIAAGLDAAHEAGVVHRDLKPENLFLTRRGLVKILDFGSSQRLLPQEDEEATLPDGDRSSGLLLGTVPYMSPEQVRGMEVDQRSDIFSLGIVVYEMLAGERPFRGDYLAATMQAIVQQDPRSLSELDPALPPALVRIVERCLEKNPDRRFRTAHDLGLALETVSLQRGSGPRTTSTDAEAAEEAVDSAGPSVAVIDFTNLSGDAETDWLTSGIAESVAADLGRLRELRVVGRQRTLQLLGPRRGSELDVEALIEMGRRLGVRWLLWGAFQKMGEVIRITAHCLDVSTGSTVETTKVDGEMSRIFELQDRVVSTFFPVMEVDLSDAARERIERPETEDLEAYELCARARQLVYRMDRETIEEAREHLERAIGLDPRYALAFSSLGHLHCMRYIGTTDPADLEAAIESLERAQELDPELADAWLWASYAHSRLDRFDRALEAARQAAALEPEEPAAHYFLGTGEWMRGVIGQDSSGFSEAVRHLLTAAELAPRFEATHLILGELYRIRGQYDAAAEYFGRAAEIERSGDFELARFVGGTLRLGAVELRRGALDRAERLLEEGLERVADSSHVYAVAQRGLAHSAGAELALRRRRFDRGLDELRSAQRELEASPRSLGLGWVLIRVHLLRARCLQALGMGGEGRRQLARAEELLERREGYDFSCVWEAGEGEARFELALTRAAARQADDALDELERAVESGWAELPRLDLEPELEIIRGRKSFDLLRERVVRLPPLP